MADRGIRPTVPEDMLKGRGWQLPLCLLLIAVVTVAAFRSLLHNDFIDFDDDLYVTANMMVRSGVTLKGLFWSFSTFHAANWHPLTWLSHMIDVELFGMNPMGHHAASLALHVANALLLCSLLHRLTGRIGRSAAVALLFAVHPLHVESVAWVAERKDLLSTLFLLLTVRAYTGYVAAPSLLRYLPVALLFTLSLMAKQMPVMLPALLLLLDWWPLKRFTHEGRQGIKEAGLLLAEKLPLVLLAAAAAAMVIRAHAAAGALFGREQGTLLLHAGNAILSYVKYLLTMFRPTGLALFYPFEAAAVTPVRVAAALVLLLLVSAAVIALRKDRPYLCFGWFWYLISLVPVIGFFRVGGQALADRYTYLPLTGIFIMIVWGAAGAAESRRKLLPAVVGAGVIIVALFSFLTARQVRVWRSSYELYAHALATVERNWLAHNNMGILLSQHNRNDEALRHFRESVRINPFGIDGVRNLGSSLQMAGRYDEAIEAYHQALRLYPDDVETLVRLGYAWLVTGNTDSAYQVYLRLNQLDRNAAAPLGDAVRSAAGR